MLPLLLGDRVLKDHFRQIGWGAGARELSVAFEVENRSRPTAEERELWIRAHEIALRAATVLAVFRGQAVVEVEDVQWGIDSPATPRPSSRSGSQSTCLTS